jgi:hypothetical protein
VLEQFSSVFCCPLVAPRSFLTYLTMTVPSGGLKWVTTAAKVSFPSATEI